MNTRNKSIFATVVKLQIATSLLGAFIIFLFLNHTQSQSLNKELERQKLALTYELGLNYDELATAHLLGLKETIDPFFKGTLDRFALSKIGFSKVDDPSDFDISFSYPESSKDSLSNPVINYTFSHARLKQDASVSPSTGIKILFITLGAMLISSLLVAFIQNRFIFTPLKTLSKELESSTPKALKLVSHGEISIFVDKFNDYINAIEQRSKITAFNETAKLVAHDIRSPVTALKMILLKNKDRMPIEETELLESAIARILSISNNLIKSPDFKTKSNPQNLVTAIEKLLSEKKIEHQLENEIDLENTTMQEDFKLNICPEEFTRILSNLINNSVQATMVPKIKITINSSSENKSIAITDNGPGLPQNIIQSLTLGQYPLPSSNGNGLGLASAKRYVESNGGQFIYSSSGNGTKIEMIFPYGQRPNQQL
ncbi:MAG: HAMP domain-containing sensor histidine kinase [Bdellovibrionota bacterium]